MNTAVIISILICVTITVLFISCLVYDYKVKTADLRSIKHFEKAFKSCEPVVLVPNHEKTTPTESARSGVDDLDFPNSRDLTEKYK